MPTTANWKLCLKCSLAGLLWIILMSRTWWGWRFQIMAGGLCWAGQLCWLSPISLVRLHLAHRHDLSLCLKAMLWNMAFFKVKKIQFLKKKKATRHNSFSFMILEGGNVKGNGTDKSSRVASRHAFLVIRRLPNN